MAQVLVRNLDTRTLRALKRRAKQHGASLEQELRTILEEASRNTFVDAESVARRIQANLLKRGIVFSDSGEMQAEDRQR